MGSKQQAKKTSGRVCCVPGCNHTQNHNRDLVFYSFPNRGWEVDRKKKWVNSVRRLNRDNTPWMPTIDSRICSSHFADGKKSNNPQTESFNPTIFPWTKLNPLAAPRSARAKRRNEIRKTSEVLQHDNEGRELDMETSLSNADIKIEEKTTCDMEIQTDIVLDDSDEGTLPVLFCWNGSGDVSTQTSIPRMQRNPAQNIIIQPSSVRPKCRTIAVGPDAVIPKVEVFDQ